MDKDKDEVFGYNDESCGGCGCGCDNSEDDHVEEFDLDEEDDIMYLTLDDDTELECKVLGIFEVEDNEYIALLPVGEDDEEDVLLYRYIGNEDDEEFELLLIEEEDEFEIVSQAFYALFVDDDEDDFVEYGSYEDAEDKE